MSISSPLGFLIAIGVLYFTLTDGIENSSVFLNTHAIVIVIGGTLAATFLCIPVSHIVTMIKIFFRTIFGVKSIQRSMQTIDEIVMVSEETNNGVELNTLLSKVKNPFFKESLELLTQGNLSETEFEDVIEKRMELQNERYKRVSSTYKMIGKFPPAFGLIGATIGMISLLQGLGDPDSFSKLGPAMSVALVATFYGLIIANLFIIPIGENLSNSSDDDLVMRRMVVDGLILIRDEKHPILVLEFLRGYLPPAERNKLKKRKT